MVLTLNTFVGAETEGFEEISDISGTTIVAAAARSGRFGFRGGTFDIAPFDFVSDAGNDYILGFGIRFSRVDPAAANTFLTMREGASEFIELQVDTNGDLLILDAERALIRTIVDPFTVDQYHYIELYFQHQASGTIELFIDNASQGSDSSRDLTDGGTFTNFRMAEISVGVTDQDDIYFFSGATSPTDRLGDCEVFGYQAGALSTTTGAPTNGTFTETGDTPGVEEADGTALEASGGSALTLTADLDAPNARGQHGGPLFKGDVYHFDASDDGPNDAGGLWNNDSNAFDGNEGTGADSLSTTAGSASSNFLGGDGTNAPSSGGTINDVYVNIRYTADSPNDVNFRVTTDAEGETLLTQSVISTSIALNSPYFKLSTPSGGWTWAKIQALEFRIWDASTSANIAVLRIARVFVEHTDGEFDVSGTIKGAKYIYNLKRSNGSGTSLRYLFGNTGDGETSSADQEGNLTTAYEIFEEVSEAAGVVPLATEDFSFGISAGTDDTGGREIFAADIWAMLLHVPDAGGADVNIVVPLGTFSLAGQVPIVGSGASVDTPLGTFTLVGQVPIVGTGAQVITPLGTFTLNSFAPTIETGVTIITPLGTFTLTGQVPTIETGVTVITPLGTFTLVGQVPVVGTGAQVITPLGTFTLTGLVPIVGSGASVDTPLGTFTLTGFAPLVATSVDIITPLGTFTLAGQVPIVGSGASIVTPLGTFTLNGLVPIVGISANIITPLGTFTFTGLVPTIETGVTVITPLGTFTLTGFAPVIAAGGVVVVTPLGTFTLTGFVPVIDIGVNIITPLRTFTLTGQIPIIGTGVDIITPLGAFTLTGFAPVITIGANIITPLGTFTLTGLVPTIETGVTIITPLGTFTLTGFAPVVAAGGVVVITPLGTFTLTGQIPIVGTGVQIVTPLGTFTLTGFVPVIGTGAEVITPLGTFTLTGQVPIVGSGAVIITPLGSFTVNFIAPIVASGVNIATPLGTFNLTGFVPIIQTGVNVLIPLGSFTFTGFSPDIVAGGPVVIVTPLGTFTLTGFAPILHGVSDATKALNLLDLTPPFEDISQIRYLFHNFALLRDVLAPGVTGQFTTTDGKTIHIRNGVVIDIF